MLLRYSKNIKIPRFFFKIVWISYEAKQINALIVLSLHVGPYYVLVVIVMLLLTGINV